MALLAIDVRLLQAKLQSRLIGMAATEEPGGGTRVALTGGVRIPTRALIPIGVRRESEKSLDRLAAML